MKKNLKKVCLLASVSSVIPTFLSIASCSKKSSEDDDVYGSIDGSDWQGAEHGYVFNPEDYEIDEENQTITYISSENFLSNDYLRIPDYVKYQKKTYKVFLGKKCFMNNDWIKGTVELNKFINIIPNQCFYFSERPSNITSVIFHQYPKIIGDFAFCSSHIDSIYVKQPNNELDKNWAAELESIGESAFENTEFSYEGESFNLLFGPSLNFVGNRAFANCYDLLLASFSHAKELTYVPVSCFEQSQKLQQVDLGPNMTLIKQKAFDGCESLQVVNVYEKNTTLTLESLCFEGCTNLRTFSPLCYFANFPEGCFNRCYNLEIQPWLNVPSGQSVPEIGRSAFEGCSFRHVIFKKNTPQPKPKSFGSYLPAVKEQGIVIDFTDFNIEYPPQWTEHVVVDIKRQDMAKVLNENGIFFDKPSFGKIRFKGTQRQFMKTLGWDDVFASLGFYNTDFADDKWSFEFIR